MDPEEAIFKWQGKTGLFRLTNKGRGTVWLMSWGEYVGQDLNRKHFDLVKGLKAIDPE